VRWNVLPTMTIYFTVYEQLGHYTRQFGSKASIDSPQSKSAPTLVDKLSMSIMEMSLHITLRKSVDQLIVTGSGDLDLGPLTPLS
jgi:hypothetical protein